MSDDIHCLVIIGSGPAALTAAIYAARANLAPILIEGNNPGGQLMSTTVVENWPGNTSIMGPKLMMNMREHAQHFGCTFIPGNASRVDFSQMPFTIWTDRDQQFKANAVITATGANPKRLGVAGEDQYWGKGITTCAVCDGAFYKDRKVIIVGGGDSAMEDASFMTRFTNDITVVQLLDTLTASYPLQKRILDNPTIKVIYSSTITQVKGDNGHVSQAVITNQKTKESQTVQVDGIFVAIGLIPNTSIFKDQLTMDDLGYLTVQDHTKTSVTGVFAAGDVADYRYRQAVTAAGSGCMAALDAERYLSDVLS